MSRMNQKILKNTIEKKSRVANNTQWRKIFFCFGNIRKITIKTLLVKEDFKLLFLNLDEIGSKGIKCNNKIEYKEIEYIIIESKLNVEDEIKALLNIRGIGNIEYENYGNKIKIYGYKFKKK